MITQWPNWTAFSHVIVKMADPTQRNWIAPWATSRATFATESIWSYWLACLKVGVIYDAELGYFFHFLTTTRVIIGFFLPLYCYKQDASTAEEMADNWRVCCIQSDLIDNETESLGGPTDLARGDLKATLRILYSIMLKYEEKKRRNWVSPPILEQNPLA